MGECSFVTEFIAGEKVENDEETRAFLGQVTEIFAEAGLGVWHINPCNPHAHTNVSRNADGDPIIIDLESAVVSPIPARGQLRSALRSGHIPIFDDIDFPRLRSFIASNESALEGTLGAERLAEFREDVDRGEEAIRAWQDSEPRLWGRLIAGVYHLLDWKGFYKRFTHMLKGADRAAENLLNLGIERWEMEGRLSTPEAAQLRAQISEGDAQNALHHMGVHLVLSVAIAIPIPGLRSAARFSWTLLFWIKARVSRIWSRASRSGKKVANVHTPLVMAVALVPALGGVAYLASPPLRKRNLARLLLDQAATKIPFKLYTRTRLNRIIVPAPR